MTDAERIRQLHRQYPVFNDLLDAISQRLEEASELLEASGLWVPGDVALYAPIVACIRDQVQDLREGKGES